jgi:hypothetical protein
MVPAVVRSRGHLRRRAKERIHVECPSPQNSRRPALDTIFDVEIKHLNKVYKIPGNKTLTGTPDAGTSARRSSRRPFT